MKNRLDKTQIKLPAQSMKARPMPCQHTGEANDQTELSLQAEADLQTDWMKEQAEETQSTEVETTPVKETHALDVMTQSTHTENAHTTTTIAPTVIEEAMPNPHAEQKQQPRPEVQPTQSQRMEVG